MKFSPEDFWGAKPSEWTMKEKMKRPRIANRNSFAYTSRLKPFVGNNMYAEWGGPQMSLYIVYSYGEHFPMYIYDEQRGVWYINEDKYSMSTSKHQSQSYPINHPNIDYKEYHNTRDMIRILDGEI